MSAYQLVKEFEIERDWNICFICQKINKEDLISPVKKKGRELLIKKLDIFLIKLVVVFAE